MAMSRWADQTIEYMLTPKIPNTAIPQTGADQFGSRWISLSDPASLTIQANRQSTAIPLGVTSRDISML